MRGGDGFAHFTATVLLPEWRRWLADHAGTLTSAVTTIHGRPTTVYWDAAGRVAATHMHATLGGGDVYRIHGRSAA